MKNKQFRLWTIVVVVALLNSVTLTAGKRVLYIGDSITDGGWGRSGGMMTPSKERNHHDLNHLYGHSYMMLCAAHYMSEYPDSDFVFFNRGISGNTLADIAARWQEDVLALNPDVVTLLVGTNDVDQFLSKQAKNPELTFDLQAWQELYEQLLHQLERQNPDVKILLGTPFVDKGGRIGAMENFAKRQEIIALLAQTVGRIAEKHHAALLPFHDLFGSLVETQPREHYWIWDGIHPTAAGHQRMADLWIATADSMAVLIR